MTSEIISEDIEIRHLQQFVVHGLKERLDIRDDWKTLMSLVTLDCDLTKPLKYRKHEIDIIERVGRGNPYKSCTEIFLDEWGTSGRRRPKINDLIMFLNKAGLKEAAKYLVVDVLKKPYESMKEDIIFEQIVRDVDVVTSENIPEDIRTFTYCQLESATNGFNSEPFNRGGNKIGEGQFGEVYYGRLNNMEIAVKKLENNVTLSTSTDTYSSSSEETKGEDEAVKLFENEVEILSTCKHKNLLRLVGFCKDTKNCIVYEYMCNGSLYDRLACLNNTAPLTTKTRYSIALGVAEALRFLHSGFTRVVIHRDVKTANVLLDENFTSKLGDFGIVRVNDRSNKETMYTSTISGTQPYMPLEAHHGAISTKTDVFSYGVVILELLTGLKPFDDKTQTPLYYYLLVEDEVPIEQVLDKKAGHWNTAHVSILEDIARHKCCVMEKSSRADMSEIVDILRKMIYG